MATRRPWRGHMRNLHIAVRGVLVAGLLLAGALVVTLTAAPAGAACGCPSRAPAATGSDAEFQGTLTAVADPGLARAGAAAGHATDLEYTFRVDRVVSGEVADTVVVAAPPDSADCTTPMVVGRRYQVATRAVASRVEMTGCAEAATLGSDVLALGRNGTSLTSDDGPDRFLVLGLAGLSLVVAAGVAVLAFDHVRRVRRSPEPLSADGVPDRR
jgi:hypothetical protein